MRRLLCAAAALALVAAPPASAEPRAAGLRPDPRTDEGGLWQKVDKAEGEARQSSELNADPALTGQIKRIACRLAQEYCPELRVYVMDRPFFNASMAPNGYMEVWSGLLLRAETEDQLAFVLGHEIGHFAESHALVAWRETKSRQNAALALSIGVAILGAGVGASTGSAQGMSDASRMVGSINNVIYLATVASLFGFSRQQEMQADHIGFDRATAAGYDPQAGGALWRNLLAETTASDFPKVRKAETRASAFDSHPVTAERIKALDDLAKTAQPRGAEDRKAYRAMIRPFLSAWLKDDLRRRDFGESLALIDRLALQGEDLGVLNFYRGEAYRMRAQSGDSAKALLAYAAATAEADCPAAAWRTLGDLQAHDGQKAAARAAYQTYLARAADAQDRWLVESALKKLDGDIGT